MKDLESIIDQYIKHGFGSMNKNDFEVFIFHFWKQRNRDKSDYAISRELKIPESKVKRLKYEASLKYAPISNKELVKQFFEDLKKAKYKKESHKLLFVINDKLVRQYVNDILEADGRFLDSSLTSSAVSIFIDDFIYLVGQLAEDAIDKNKILQVAESKAKIIQDFPTSYSEIIKQFIVGRAKDTIGEFTTDAIVDAIKHTKEVINN